MSAASIPDLRSGVIYAILEPDKEQIRYVGKAARFGDRKRQHRCDLKSGEHGNRHLQRWFNKLENKAIRFRVLQECLPGTMDACEEEWIARLRKKGHPLCNIDDGGVGHALSCETKKKLSEISKARWATKEYQERHAAHRLKRFGALNKTRREPKAHVIAYRREQWRQKQIERNAVRVPLTILNKAALLHLGNGLTALIDAEDWQRASKHGWHIHRRPGKPPRVKASLGDGKAILLSRFIMNATGNDRIERRGNLMDYRKINLVAENGYRFSATSASCG